jgi:hypothetical protein
VGLLPETLLSLNIFISLRLMVGMEACENCSLCWLMLFRLYSSVFSVIGVKIYWLVTLLLTFFFAGEAKPTF